MLSVFWTMPILKSFIMYHCLTQKSRNIGHQCLIVGLFVQISRRSVPTTLKVFIKSWPGVYNQLIMFQLQNRYVRYV